MNNQESLEILVDEFLRTKDFRYISIHSAKRNERILIMDAETVFLEKNVEFNLSVLLSFNTNSKKGNSKLKSILKSPEFNSIEKRKDGRNTILVTKPSNSKKQIIENIELLRGTFFKELNPSELIIEAVKPNRMTIS